MAPGSSSSRQRSYDYDSLDPHSTAPTMTEHSPLLLYDTTLLSYDTNPARGQSVSDAHGHGGDPCEQDPPRQITPSGLDTIITKYITDLRQCIRFPETLVLANTASTARDHLASERTFLAYIRTGLSIASAGVALAQLVSNYVEELGISGPNFTRYMIGLAGSAVVLGLGVIFLGSSRYFAIQRALLDGQFPVTRFWIGGIAFLLAMLIFIAFTLLIVS
ncbi:unnamed protein product [Mycena citricolor]|uniref:DUF202 domain-containing protein n=1 Tax=Mycena citricolor TaxID=2018698 RepID=A0AAD2H929_9AGAR|nr:unnamed protein product [Mycena citricolor]